jgi:hypothetical protein
MCWVCHIRARSSCLWQYPILIYIYFYDSHKLFLILRASVPYSDVTVFCFQSSKQATSPLSCHGIVWKFQKTRSTSRTTPSISSFMHLLPLHLVPCLSVCLNRYILKSFGEATCEAETAALFLGSQQSHSPDVGLRPRTRRSRFRQVFVPRHVATLKGSRLVWTIGGRGSSSSDTLLALR